MITFWKWLTTPDPNPGFTRNKLLKLFARVLLFAFLATILSSLLSLTPLRPYLNTWWGSMLFVLALYLPLYRFLSMDALVAPRRPVVPAGKAAAAASQSRRERRKERHRFAGVKKGPPRYGGGGRR